MKMFLLGFLACYIIASLLIYNDADEWLDRFITPFCAVGIVVLIIPFLFGDLCVFASSQ